MKRRYSSGTRAQSLVKSRNHQHVFLGDLGDLAVCVTARGPRGRISSGPSRSAATQACRRVRTWKGDLTANPVGLHDDAVTFVVTASVGRDRPVGHLTSQPGDWRFVTDGDSSAVADTRYPPYGRKLGCLRDRLCCAVTGRSAWAHAPGWEEAAGSRWTGGDEPASCWRIDERQAGWA